MQKGSTLFPCKASKRGLWSSTEMQRLQLRAGMEVSLLAVIQVSELCQHVWMCLRLPWVTERHLHLNHVKLPYPEGQLINLELVPKAICCLEVPVLNAVGSVKVELLLALQHTFIAGKPNYKGSKSWAASGRQICPINNEEEGSFLNYLFLFLE